MNEADRLFQKASDLQFKQKNLAVAYEKYKELVNNFPDYPNRAVAQQMMHTIEKNNTHLTEDEKAELIREENEKRVAMSNMLISSGFNFEGYRIVKYSGYISGDDAIQIPRSGLFDRGMNGQRLTDALVQIRRQALIELKEAAYNIGCNAVIGVDFDYITLEPQTASMGHTIYEPYVICVTANGNAVVIEKE